VIHARWLAMAAEMILAALVVVGLLASGSAFPILGVFLSLLSPVPFVLLRLRHGFAALIVALMLTSLAVMGLSSPGQAVAFLLEFGFPAIVLAETLRRGSRPEFTVAAVAVLLTAGGLAVLVLASDTWTQPLSAISQHVERLLTDMEVLSARLGISVEGAPPLYGTGTKLRAFLLMAFPGMFFAGMLLTAAGYVLFLRALMSRWSAQLGGVSLSPLRWELPEPLVWAFIGAGILSLTGFPGLQAVGLNILIVLIGLYFLQGLSIAAFLFQRFHLPKSLGALSVLLLVFQPFLTLVVAGLGLFDVWFAFRRLSLPKTPRQT
jgi:uncharacterized protein YybS (DUF2232 family)